MKQGDVVRVKISGETGYVVALDDAGEGIAKIRRAKQTKDGIVYVTDILFADELETVEANIDREFKEVLYRHKLATSKQKDAEEEEYMAGTDDVPPTIQ